MDESFDLEAGKKRIEETGRFLFKRVNSRIIGFQVWAVVLAPLSECLISQKIFPFDWTTNWYLYIIFLIIVMTHCYSGFHVSRAAAVDFHYFDFKDLYRQHNDLIGEYNRLKNKVKTIQHINDSIRFSLVSLEQFLADANQHDNISSDKVKDGFRVILYPFIVFREKIFGFQSGALYNFAVFLYDKNYEGLKAFYRQHSRRLNPKKRSWKIGRGHVGICFAQKDLKISTDIMKSDELATDIKPGDKEYYRSMVSIPINKIGDTQSSDEQPYGVLVITSSHTNQFNKSLHATLFLTLAKILTIFCHKTFDKLDGAFIYEYD